MTGFGYFKAASRSKCRKMQTLPRTSWEISAVPNNFGQFALFFLPSVKYVNTFKQNSDYFNTSLIIYSYFSNRFEIDYRYHKGNIYNRCLLNVDT